MLIQNQNRFPTASLAARRIPKIHIHTYMYTYIYVCTLCVYTYNDDSYRRVKNDAGDTIDF